MVQAIWGGGGAGGLTTTVRGRGEDGASWVLRSSGDARPEAEAAFFATQGVDGVSNIPTGWTVFEIPSTPWAHTVRPIGLVRPGFSA